MKAKADNLREHKKSLQRLKAADRLGHIAHQLKLCEDYLKRFPDDLVAWYFYGEALASLKRHQAAEEAFAKTLKLGGRPARRYVHGQLGLMYSRAGDYRRALRSFEKVIKLTLGTDDASFHVLAGDAAWKLGKLQKAERHFQKGTTCSEGSPDEAWFNLGGVLLTQGRYEEAVACYEKTLSLCPRFPSARRRLRDLKLALAQ